MVFAMGSPFSGRDCVLPQSAIVTPTFPPSGGFGSWPLCGVPCLRLALCSSSCVGSEAVPPSTWFGPAPSRRVPLLRARCVWGLQPLASSVCSFGMWSPFGSKVSFCHF